MVRARVALVVLALPLLGSQCKRGGVDVAPLTSEDESLRKSQDSLIGQRGALQRERKKISDERAELVDRRKKLGHDSAGQAVLDDEERKLIEREQKLNAEEAELDRQLGELIKQRSELIKKATQVVATAPGADPLESAARREQSVAAREKELASREKELASREKDLAEREARLARRERETCGGAAPVQIEIPKGLKYSARDVEPIYKKALRLMQDKGLLPADLPPGASRLVDETREAMRKGDYVRAKYDADALYEAVKEVKIDREFISAKMNRLAAAMRGTKLNGDHRKNVEQLFQEATAAYGDGHFSQANGKINRLFALLK